MKKQLDWTKYHAEVWKLDDFKEFLLESCNGVYNQDPIENWRKGCILPFPKNGDLSTLKTIEESPLHKQLQRYTI